MVSLAMQGVGKLMHLGTKNVNVTKFDTEPALHEAVCKAFRVPATSELLFTTPSGDVVTFTATFASCQQFLKDGEQCIVGDASYDGGKASARISVDLYEEERRGSLSTSNSSAPDSAPSTSAPGTKTKATRKSEPWNELAAQVFRDRCPRLEGEGEEGTQGMYVLLKHVTKGTDAYKLFQRIRDSCVANITSQHEVEASVVEAYINKRMGSVNSTMGSGKLSKPEQEAKDAYFLQKDGSDSLPRAVWKRTAAFPTEKWESEDNSIPLRELKRVKLVHAINAIKKEREGVKSQLTITAVGNENFVASNPASSRVAAAASQPITTFGPTGGDVDSFFQVKQASSSAPTPAPAPIAAAANKSGVAAAPADAAASAKPTARAAARKKAQTAAEQPAAPKTSTGGKKLRASAKKSTAAE